MILWRNFTGGIEERAGSGISDIYQVWENQGWTMPVVEESYNPDRTRLSLEFSKKQAIKTSEENKRRKQAKKTSEESKLRKTEENYKLIRKDLKKKGLSKTKHIQEQDINSNQTFHLVAESNRKSHITNIQQIQ